MKRLEKKKSDFRRDPSLERLFISLQPPLDLRRELAKNNILFTKEQRNFTFVEQDQLHLTLKFLGSGVSNESKEQIISLLNEISHDLQAPRVKVLNLQFGFPRQMVPSVLFYNIESNASMQKLTSLIHEKIMELELEDIKREKDYKKMVYHLTIARSKHSGNRAFGRKIRTMIKQQAKSIDTEFVPTILYLIKSNLTHGSKPTYEILAQFPLTIGNNG